MNTQFTSSISKSIKKKIKHERYNRLSNEIFQKVLRGFQNGSDKKWTL